MNQYKVLSISHKDIALSALEKFVIPFDVTSIAYKNLISQLKYQFLIDEMMYLNTCNRVNYFFTSKQDLPENFPTQFYKTINSEIEACHSMQMEVFEGIEAIKYMCELGCSMHSMVLGEREILKQMRKAYDLANEQNFTGDDIRLAMKFIIPTAKQIYTETKIAEKPISIVSIAAQKILEKNIPYSSRIFFIGASSTNSNMAAYLKEYGYQHFIITSRNKEHAFHFSKKFQAQIIDWNAKENYKGGFDILISATASSEIIVTKEFYKSLIQQDTSNKILVDLALPYDIDKEIVQSFSATYIEIESLKQIAEKNKGSRSLEKQKAKKRIALFVKEFQDLYMQRAIEKAHERIPSIIHEIRTKAVQEVYAKEIASMDLESKETLEMVLQYIEKKYIALTISSAKNAMKYKL